MPELSESTKDTVDSLFAIGLNAEVVSLPSVLPEGTVVGTVPLAGTLLRQGSTVIVEESNGVAPVIAMFDMRGIDKSQVGAVISQFASDNGISLTWSLVEVTTSSPTQDGVVVSTLPAVGTPVMSGQNIVVRIGKTP